ncbi:hypothetical protein [Desulfosporosinus sp. OT]|uniref:hypothetical protein n=1 Tax=Desulfosporosinus sp. OT TaxID=913865 RepID=UPI000223A923|nr:hypothetical protein [Desulfosporosinus sp. OT]EGW39093.1 hypothetical protein DOT_3044 [Desulfosporosinus sp. OT]
MADKNFQMRRKKADGSFDNYFPVTKAANVNMNDGTTVEAKVVEHLATKATESIAGHVTVDGQTIFVNNGELTLINPNNPILYNHGIENLVWGTGYSTGTGVQSKETDHLHLEAVNGERAYVTPVKVDLSNITTLKADVAVTRYSAVGNPTFYLIVSSNPAGSASVYDAMQSSLGLTGILALDVSALTGEYYVRIHAKCASDSSWLHADINKIWGE